MFCLTQPDIKSPKRHLACSILHPKQLSLHQHDRLDIPSTPFTPLVSSHGPPNLVTNPIHIQRFTPLHKIPIPPILNNTVLRTTARRSRPRSHSQRATHSSTGIVCVRVVTFVTVLELTVTDLRAHNNGRSNKQESTDNDEEVHFLNVARVRNNVVERMERSGRSAYVGLYVRMG